MRYAYDVPIFLPLQDQRLVQIVDAALADAARRSGKWLLCKPGCATCCIGVFAIDQLDSVRLRDGLAKLEAVDPARAARVLQRAHESIARISHKFPGDPHTGLLGDDDEAAERFEKFGDDERCPALDPEKGTCDLYQWRPMTCRQFGPPVRSDGGLGVCELCYRDVSPDEIAACELDLVAANTLQAELVGQLEAIGLSGNTIVAFALSAGPVVVE
jgi:Fe-S-cluster containining protein